MRKGRKFEAEPFRLKNIFFFFFFFFGGKKEETQKIKKGNVPQLPDVVQLLLLNIFPALSNNHLFLAGEWKETLKDVLG